MGLFRKNRESRECIDLEATEALYGYGWTWWNMPNAVSDVPFVTNKAKEYGDRAMLEVDVLVKMAEEDPDQAGLGPLPAGFGRTSDAEIIEQEGLDALASYKETMDRYGTCEAEL